MRSVKARGLEELALLRRRLRRAFALRRIGFEDFEYIDTKLNEVEVRIISMSETNEDGEEEG